VPSGQIIGSTSKTSCEIRDGKPAMVRLPGMDFRDDNAGKPAAIQIRSIDAYESG
jgi:hypothetical protein